MSRLILTATRRLASAQREQFEQQQITVGSYVWQTPTILPLSTWLQQVWEDLQHRSLLPAKYLLPPWQEQIIWQDIIRQSNTTQPLLNINYLAELAQQAWQLIKLWRVPIDSKIFHSEQHRCFYRWMLDFQTHCQQQNLQSQAELFPLVLDAIQQQHINLPTEIILLGFDELTPSLEQLQQLVTQQKTKFEWQTPTTQTANRQRVALENQESELLCMARWAKQYVQHNPQHKIACIVPNLTSIRLSIIRTFQQVFADMDAEQVFNISAGSSLASYPVINTALQLLNIEKQIPLETLSNIIRSAFLLGADEEISARAYIDGLLRATGETQTSLGKLLHLLLKLAESETTPYKAPQLTSICSALLNLHPPEQGSASEYSQYFLQRLQVCGWPGERNPNSHEYQAVQRLVNLLKEFAALEHILPQLTFAEAKQYFTALANKTTFQPESTDTPIQILGFLEAAGLNFDAVWVLGLDANTWPSAASANPFIPIQLQREHNLPHSSNQREYHYCKQITARLSTSAQTVIFSHAQQEQDSELKPSPLISHIEPISISELNVSEAPATQLDAATMDLENFIDNTAPPLQKDEKVRGGSSILKQQAACPFRAFAQLRLNAQGFGLQSLGLTAMERGTLVHRILEKLWQKLGDQATLLAYSEQQLEELVTNIVTNVLFGEAQDDESRRSKQLLQLEKTRLVKLTLHWLEQEKQRPAFTVMQEEQRCQYELAGIKFNLQLDRLDKLDNGDYVIIDYKTGKPNISAWFGERPDEPQLPLYAIIDQETQQANAVCFGLVRSDACRFSGVSQHDLQIKGVWQAEKKYKIDWHTIRQQWQTTLTRLAEEFAAGHAEVDPKDNTTCQFCDLQSLCRIA